MWLLGVLLVLAAGTVMLVMLSGIVSCALCYAGPILFSTPAAPALTQPSLLCLLCAGQPLCA